MTVEAFAITTANSSYFHATFIYGENLIAIALRSRCRRVQAELIYYDEGIQREGIPKVLPESLDYASNPFLYVNYANSIFTLATRDIFPAFRVRSTQMAKYSGRWRAW